MSIPMLVLTVLLVFLGSFSSRSARRLFDRLVGSGFRLWANRLRPLRLVLCSRCWRSGRHSFSPLWVRRTGAFATVSRASCARTLDTIAPALLYRGVFRPVQGGSCGTAP